MIICPNCGDEILSSSLTAFQSDTEIVKCRTCGKLIFDGKRLAEYLQSRYGEGWYDLALECWEKGDFTKIVFPET
jgi:transcription elongation factor Elf1